MKSHETKKHKNQFDKRRKDNKTLSKKTKMVRKKNFNI
jgi:hypothetical protein